MQTQVACGPHWILKEFGYRRGGSCRSLPHAPAAGSCWAGLENTHVNVQGGLLGRQERLQSAGVLSPTRQLPQGTEAGLEFFAASGGRCPAPHAMSDRRALRSIFTSILFHRRQRCRLKTSRHGVRVSAWHCKSSDALQRAAARCRTWFVTAWRSHRARRWPPAQWTLGGAACCECFAAAHHLPLADTLSPGPPAACMPIQGVHLGE